MYRITRALSVGPFPSPERADAIRAAGVTHVLNVSGGPAAVTDGFCEAVSVPIRDSGRLSPRTAIKALDALHRMASEPDAHVYVHCVFGQQRSPTVLWLYLVACGYPADYARELVETRSPDATAGHPRLVGPGLVAAVQMHGLMNYLPLPRGDVVVPFGGDSQAVDATARRVG